MSFRRRYPIRFGDIDHAGIAFYPTLMRLCHDAFEDAWLHGMGRHYQEVCDDEHLGFPAVHIDADFTAPLRFGNDVEIVVTVDRVGTKSVTWRYQFLRQPDGVAAAELKITTAAVDLRDFSSMVIPDWCRDLLAKLTVAH